MTDIVTTIRLHLADRKSYLLVPWATLLGVFLANLVIAVLLRAGDSDGSGGLIMLAAFLVVLEIIAVTKWTPFALLLGLTRTRYYVATALVVAVVSAVWAAVVATLAAAESATSGWGLDLRFFRMSHVLDGPWQQGFAAAAIGLFLSGMVGLCLGAIHRRWGWTGIIILLATLLVLVVAAVLLATARSAWTGIGEHIRQTTLGAYLAGGAVLALLVGGAGLVTLRRAAL